MIRHPPAYVPADIASAADTITHVGGLVKSASRSPEATSASAMIPIVFWASFVPCVSATKPPETSWPRRKMRLILAGDRRLIIQTISGHQGEREGDPGEGGDQRGLQHLLPKARPLDDRPSPAAMIAEPMRPPISAWLELDGSPRYHVTRFQVIAPTRPARRISSVIASGSTIPWRPWLRP